jgi:phospholipid/cholesterol/gamma-HCH transport system ATP-binding protein
LVSHDIQEACEICDLIFIIADSKIVAGGSPDDLKCSSNPQVQQFMLGLPDGTIPFNYPAVDYREDLL